MASANRLPSTARQVAAGVVRQVVHDGAYSHIALSAALDRRSTWDVRDRGLATELVYGTLTWLRPIDTLLGELIARGAASVDPHVLSVLRVAIYQIRYLDRIPDRAAVHSAVAEVAALPGGSRSKGFVNGVLRAALRQRDAGGWEPGPIDDPVMRLVRRWALPRWMARRFIGRYGVEEAERLAASLAQRPEMMLRVAPDADLLSHGETQQRPSSRVPSAVSVASMTADVRGWIDSGAATVQDEAAQLVGLLANPAAAERTLDGCAGVGGKTTHLAELRGSSEGLTAVEPHASKTVLLEGTFNRLGRPAPSVFVGSLDEFAAGTRRDPFDCLVLDVPCSGLGVIRRHPEIRWTRTEAQIVDLASIQRGLLETAASLVAPGGRIIYAACTFTHEEGPDQIAGFLARHPEFTVELRGHPSVDWDAIRHDELGFELRPHDAGTDGFFFTRLVRATGDDEVEP